MWVSVMGGQPILLRPHPLQASNCAVGWVDKQPVLHDQPLHDPVGVGAPKPTLQTEPGICAVEPQDSSPQK
jgi:hypothetical protein